MKPLARLQWLEAVARDRDLPPLAAHVAITLAGFVNSQTGGAYPGIHNLAAGTRLHRSTVIRMLDALERAEYVVKHRGGGRGKATEWHLNTVALAETETAPETVAQTVPLAATESKQTVPQYSDSLEDDDDPDTVPQTVPQTVAARGTPTGGTWEGTLKKGSYDDTQRDLNITDLDKVAPASDDARRPRKRNANGHAPPTAATWNAYADAYARRYGEQPVRNARVNGQLANFVSRIPHADAPELAAWFVGHNGRFYVQKLHPVGLLLADAESLHTQWRQGRMQTESAARETDGRQKRGEVWAKLINEAREAEQRGND